MKLKVYYSGKDFFGHWDNMLEARNDFANLADLKTAFRQLKKDSNCTIHAELKTIFYSNLADFENDIVTIRDYATWNSYDESKMSYAKAKKIVLDSFKGLETE